jgi:hypothetical protein
MAANQASTGIQAANQTQAQGQAQEMQTAAGQAAGVDSSISGQDIGVAGQNAQLGQQNNQFNAGAQQQNSQFNAGMTQQANMANQSTATQADQSLQQQANAEMQERMTEQGMVNQTANPGGPGAVQNFANGVLGALAKGGIVHSGPKRVLVGEDGPEAIVSLDHIVDSPTITTLGTGAGQAVIPLSNKHSEDRQKVVRSAIDSRDEQGMGRLLGAPIPNDGGGVYNSQLPGTVGLFSRPTPNFGGTAQGFGASLGANLGNGKLADSGGGGGGGATQSNGLSPTLNGMGASPTQSASIPVAPTADAVAEEAPLALAFARGGIVRNKPIPNDGGGVYNSQLPGTVGLFSRPTPNFGGTAQGFGASLGANLGHAVGDAIKVAALAKGGIVRPTTKMAIGGLLVPKMPGKGRY